MREEPGAEALPVSVRTVAMAEVLRVRGHEGRWSEAKGHGAWGRGAGGAGLRMRAIVKGAALLIRAG
ncbi:hypothetical protein GCM10010449_61200 [Streptomyces rectiviolaceus]|uniref:Uncharacterized protein n=1 Tax=Streptomyces rectiviolaceus TaxID=332591 RepID=A0ABP6N0P3_9ACTN